MMITVNLNLFVESLRIIWRFVAEWSPGKFENESDKRDIRHINGIQYLTLYFKRLILIILLY